MHENLIICRFKNDYYPNSLDIKSILCEKLNKSFQTEANDGDFNKKLLSSASRSKKILNLLMAEIKKFCRGTHYYEFIDIKLIDGTPSNCVGGYYYLYYSLYINFYVVLFGRLPTVAKKYHFYNRNL